MPNLRICLNKLDSTRLLCMTLLSQETVHRQTHPRVASPSATYQQIQATPYINMPIVPT